MATTSNKLIPLLGTFGAVVIVGVLYQQFSGPSQPKADAPMKSVPDPAKAKAGLPKAAGADNDTPAETLATVVASNTQLRQDVAKIIETNNRLTEENRRLGGTGGAGTQGSSNNPSAASVPAPQATGTSSTSATAIDPPAADKSALGNAIDTAAEAADTLMKGLPGAPSSSGWSTTRGPSTGSQAVPGSRAGAAGWSDAGAAAQADSPAGVVQYKLMTPMGYVAHVDPARGSGAVATTRFVRTTQPSGDAGAAGTAGPATQAARAAAQKAEDTPFFTLPENSTLAGVTAMTSLIGRVPIDGRVTDPMQFKAMVGRDNLAASGWELPPDIAGMIVTGVAIGDMALSCSEGKVRSITFVFNDGTVRTVSSRNRGGGISTGSGSGGSSGGDIGFISDLHGNPCIPGKFVTNAASYLTDISMLRGLGVAGQAFADAQRTQRNNNDGSTSSSITGDRGRFAMGQAVSGATDEVTQWMLQRLRNSFDAVIVPSGKQLVIHLDQEIRLDKAVNARRLVHRQQGAPKSHEENAMVSNDPTPLTPRTTPRTKGPARMRAALRPPLQPGLMPAAFLSMALLGTGCSVTGNRESPINEVTRGSPTVLDIYRGKAAAKDDEGGQTARTRTAQDRLREASSARPIAAGDADTQRYWSALEPMRQRFARVPNPDLVMVVYPHLARGTYPVPGYVTTFPMYEQTFYALPGEVEQDLQAGRTLRPAAGANTAKSTR